MANYQPLINLDDATPGPSGQQARRSIGHRRPDLNARLLGRRVSNANDNNGIGNKRPNLIGRPLGRRPNDTEDNNDIDRDPNNRRDQNRQRPNRQRNNNRSNDNRRSQNREQNESRPSSSGQSHQNRNHAHRFNQDKTTFRDSKNIRDDKSKEKKHYENRSNDNNGHNNRNRNPKRSYLNSFKYVEELLKLDAETLILKLQNDQTGFCQLLKNDLTNDFLILVIKLLDVISKSSFLNAKLSILQTAFQENFLNKLIKFIAYLPMHDQATKKKSSYFWNDTNDFWTKLLGICEVILDNIPTFACDTLPQLINAITVYIAILKGQGMVISEENLRKINNLSEAIEILQQESIKKIEAQKQEKKDIDEEPPDDFHDIDIYPKPNEILENNSFLRNNVIKGSYRNISHYLDIHFRLLREDFIAPLRSGLMSYVRNNFKFMSKEQIRIHKKIHFLYPERVNQYDCYRIRFNFDNKKNLKQMFKDEQSKRFMYGSLVCFTIDSFNTIFFGRVASSKVDELQNGELVVSLDNPVNILYNTNYQMIECNVYFEPYFHVLNVLKKLPIDSFPMENYILYVQTTSRPPRYLEKADIQLNLLTDFNNKCRIIRNNLNDSQLIAYNAALSQEFTLIQGPPGTGKTYLGLELVKTLLIRSELWHDGRPMLIICYTNHALDQFLEGLLPFTNEIIRVGGQSKNEKLQMLNLRKYKSHNVGLYDIRRDLQSLLNEIKSITEHLNYIDKYIGVLDFNEFENLNKEDKKLLGNILHASREEQVNWLFGGREQTDPNEEQNNQVDNKNNQENNDDDEDNDTETEDEEMEIVSEYEGEEDDDVQRTVGEEDEIFGFQSIHIREYNRLITLKYLEDIINSTEKNLEALTGNGERILEKLQLESQLNSLQLKYAYLQWRLQNGMKTKDSLIQPKDTKRILHMSPDERWDLYFYLLNKYKQLLRHTVEIKDKEFKKLYERYEDLRCIEELQSMRKTKIIGMTTTCAARLRSTLEAIQSPIVIVEEAAEVLESHIIAALTPGCQQLILIGDHQQLKPSTADFKVERHYQLGISLFERMVLNNIHCYALDVQHRMRPEIASLITPNIYPNLKNHQSVYDRKPIAGVDKSVYFIDHNHAEDSVKDGTTKKNLHEAEFLIAFAKHLVLNGYKAENITVIAAYLGQMFEMRRIRKKFDRLKYLKIVVLDNYQGEENDIILLSLVRNNNENNVGFLKIENRVCVALSRARNGLYIMGNMTLLCNASTLWCKIREELEKQDAIGNELTLRCQIHYDQITKVKSDKDFLTISEGGCSKICNILLKCGHNCNSLCHIENRDHEIYKCTNDCNRLLCDLDESHICKKMCYQKCGPCDYLVFKNLPCGHVAEMYCSEQPELYKCKILIPTELNCGHSVNRPCYRDKETFRCPEPCKLKVEPCGHVCVLKCHVNNDPDHLEYKCPKKCVKHYKNCTTKIDSHLCQKLCYEECPNCEIIVEKIRTKCPHRFKIPCHLDVDSFDCEKPCIKMLECGHKCKRKCFEPCGGCKAVVEKSHPICGHKLKTKCSEEPNRKNCNNKCPLMLECGHQCTKLCKEACTKECKVLIDWNLIGLCGHQIKQIPCYKRGIGNVSSDLVQYCKEPCKQILKCGHLCGGTCGQCLQGRSHKRCSQKCGAVNICNHPCNYPCREACRPCNLKCTYNCEHSKCTKKCGEPCTPCAERCGRICQHQECTAKCGDICTVPPCMEPCDLILECGHNCVGFCGDPCPPCRICDTSNTYELFFGTEEDDDAKFIVLNDCQHVIESSAMEAWIQQDQLSIGFKTCPKCKTVIKTTKRLTDYLKESHQDVIKVKVKLLGTHKENFSYLERIKSKFLNVLPKLEILEGKLQQVLENIRQRVLPTKKKRIFINKIELCALDSKISILDEIAKIKFPSSSSINIDRELEIIISILNRETDFITQQEVIDVEKQLSRLSRLAEYYTIRENVNFTLSLESKRRDADNLITTIEKYLLKLGPYEKDDDKYVKEKLEELNKMFRTGLNISDKERKEILKAMGFSKGHWYKCPNGHVYAIADCGGAMVESTCNECGAKIGGRSHSLRSDNAVATEMDGATHSAWSEAANMNNYRF